MKKFLITVALLVGFAAMASAQPRSLGVRFSGGGVLGAEISYEHFVNSRPDFVEAAIGFPVWNGVVASATYNHVFYEPYWTDAGDWAIYAGAGLVTGVTSNSFTFGIMGQAGIEYSFWFPLQISLDIRPSFGVSGSSFYRAGLWGFLPALSLRYKF